MYEKYQLANKAKVILVPQNDTTSITILIMYPVGSRYEPEKIAGVSHFVEHLMFKGTEKRKNTLTLTREIDRLGAEYNAFTGKEYTAYYIKVDATYTKTALDILSDMLFHSKFDAKELEREKTVVVEELRMYEDNPVMNIDTTFENLLYAGSPLGRDIGGTPRHVMSYTRPDVLAYRERYYQPSNMTIVAAGRVTSEATELIQRFFGDAKSTGKVSSTFKPACFGSSRKEDRLIVKQKKTDQAQLTLGFPGFSYQAPEDPTVSVMNTIFGGSMSSRLFIQVRERRGYAYSVRSGSDNFRDTGHVFVRAGLEVKNINKAIRVIQDEMKKLTDKKVTPRELADAKTHIRGRLMLSMEDSSSQANWYASEAVFMGQIATPEERLARLEAVSAEEIQLLAKKLFREKEMRVAIIGDVKKEDVQF